jgi:hypothetical protein
MNKRIPNVIPACDWLEECCYYYYFFFSCNLGIRLRWENMWGLLPEFDTAQCGNVTAPLSDFRLIFVFVIV